MLLQKFWQQKCFKKLFEFELVLRFKVLSSKGMSFPNGTVAVTKLAIQRSHALILNG